MNYPGKINKCPLCLIENESAFLGYRLNKTQGLFPGRDYSNATKVYCCKRCDLVYNHPPAVLPVDSFVEDDSLLTLAQAHSDLGNYEGAHADIIDFLKHTAKLKAGAKVLDVGSGIGRAAYVLRQAGFEVYSIEPKKELYDFANQNKLTQVERSFNRSFEDCDFEKEKFDFIFLEPLNHFSEPHAAIQKALVWLKPGGYLHLETVNKRWLYKSILLFIYRFTFTKVVPFTSPLRKPYNVCEYSAKTFKVYCSLNNLKLSRLGSYACETYIKNKWADKMMRNFMERYYCGMEMSVIVQKQ
ncbi:MAG: class I SAM-dependent methyltransferase [Bacteroidota bacterium]|nr:class I SAM-dependent methyltransferase [Bacteroidota bacterium]